ncbi:hypothetical protein AeMF1_018951 [Aphanomyces euteiches]|nr:hypothetical protein AeMF1_018951 [Aphanomyces euteiches]
MAHTAKRQLRCAKKLFDNAAARMESLLRNTRLSDLMQSVYGIQINQTILTAVLTLPGGTTWVANLMQLMDDDWGSIPDEVAYWRSQGTTYFAIQYQNRFQTGNLNRIDVVNALGITRSMTISTVPYISRSLSLWSTRYVNTGWWNDIRSKLWVGNWDTIYTGATTTVGGDIVRAYVGPFMTWDTKVLSPPPSLLKMLANFHTQFYDLLRSDISFSSAYQNIFESDVDVVPSNWGGQDMLYYGGNPMCSLITQPKTYVQMPFSFDDACQRQDRLAILFARTATLFSMWISQPQTSSTIATSCNLSLLNAITCNRILTSTMPLVSKLTTPDGVSSVVQDLQSLNLLFVQLASRNLSKILLTQPIIPNIGDPWSPFGWMTLYDWVDGTREAYAFEGDVGSLSLMSARSANLPVASNPLELPRTALSTSAMRSSYSALGQYQSDGRNFFQINRVVGSVWAGRPLMFLRGTTAILVLSTSPATLTSVNQVTYFENVVRHWIVRLILSGESLWVSYAMNDVLLPITQQYSRIYTPLHSLLSFIAIFVLDTVAPVQARATVAQNCCVRTFRRGIVCSGSVIEIGSFDRVVLLFGVHGATLAVSIAVVLAWARCSHKKYCPQIHKEVVPMLIPAPSESYLFSLWGSTWHSDSTICIMSGILPIRSFLFDFKTWTLISRSNTRVAPGDVQHEKIPSNDQNKAPKFLRRHVLFGYLTLLFMAGSIGGGYTFIQLTKSAMTNEFLWSSFNASTQVFLSNWFNLNLQVMSLATHLELTPDKYGYLATSTNTSALAILSSPLYANAVQDESNSLRNVIQGLRQTDGCQVPWIMTTYCYVDFGGTWEMAATQKLQDKCSTSKSNGAVYLESILRNVDAETFSACWGASLEVGVFSFLKSSNDGIAWLTKTWTQQSRLSIDMEVEYWTNSKIIEYTTQWQNYKSLGVTESFSIQNAFGFDFPLTLKYSNGSYQFNVVTSFKMQMPLASLLSSITLNSSVVSGQSLLRTSSNFAFRNITPESVLISEGYLTSPWGPGLAAVRSSLGPFGMVTMKRISCPPSLKGLFQNISYEISRLLSSTAEVQNAFWPLYNQFSINPRPRAWEGASLGGGDIMCDVVVAATTGTAPCVHFSSAGSCAVNGAEFIPGDTKLFMTGLVAVNSTVNITALYKMDARSPGSTKVALETNVPFLKKYLAPDRANLLFTQAQQVKADVWNNYKVSMLQFLRRGSTITLSNLRIFDPSDADFEFFFWMYLFDWAQGVREVVSFQGENSTITAISTNRPFIETQPNPTEVPSNVAYLMSLLMQYITSVLLCVGGVVFVYILGLGGQVEAMNIISFSRVGSLVWIGRSFIFVRALAAIALLSTATLTLERPLSGLISLLNASATPWYTVILAAGELNWMVYVVNDIFSVFTQHIRNMVFCITTNRNGYSFKDLLRCASGLPIGMQERHSIHWQCPTIL